MNSEIQIEQEARPSERLRGAGAREGDKTHPRHRTGAAVIAIAPLVVLVAFLYHPHIGNPSDPEFLERLGAAVEADTKRWAFAHLLLAVGSGLVILAFLALRTWLREAGDERWSRVGLPFIVMGSVFYALLPAMEFAPLTAVGIGADPAAAQGALLPWFVPVLFTSALLFGIGAVAFALAIARNSLLSPAMAWFVAICIIVMGAARFVPLSFVQFHVQGTAGILALWPLAYALWKS